MPANPHNDALMAWLINVLAEKFPAQAILKGGMELRLLNCPRYTNDLDYVFVPYTSKNDVAGPIVEALSEYKELTVEHSMHSTCLRVIVTRGDARVQIEVNVAGDCKTQELSTSDFARPHHVQGHIIRAMSLDIALSHKLAAWLERGLVRDLYDVYFIREALGVTPDIEVLSQRLSRLHYQRGKTKGPRSMSISQFCSTLRSGAEEVNAEDLRGELEALLASEELPGLEFKIRKAMLSIADRLNNRIDKPAAG
jgi:hypothetical protein